MVQMLKVAAVSLLSSLPQDGGAGGDGVGLADVGL